MSSGTADALGLSRAILCNGEIRIIPHCEFVSCFIGIGGYKTLLGFFFFNFTDGLVKRLEELEKTAELYKGKGESAHQTAPQ